MLGFHITTPHIYIHYAYSLYLYWHLLLLEDAASDDVQPNAGHPHGTHEEAGQLNCILIMCPVCMSNKFCIGFRVNVKVNVHKQGCGA